MTPERIAELRKLLKIWHEAADPIPVNWSMTLIEALDEIERLRKALEAFVRIEDEHGLEPYHVLVSFCRSEIGLAREVLKGTP